MVLPFFSTTISGNQNEEIIGITSTKKNWVVAGNVVGDFLGTTPLGPLGPLDPLGGVDSWVTAFGCQFGVLGWKVAGSS